MLCSPQARLAGEAPRRGLRGALWAAAWLGAALASVGCATTPEPEEPVVVSAEQAPNEAAEQPLRARQQSDETSDAVGSDGLAQKGTGKGGGRASPGVGMGSVGSIGDGIGRGGIKGYGSPPGKLTRRRDARPSLRAGRIEVKGPLQKESIDVVVHRHFRQIYECYEQTLRHNAQAHGKIVVQVVIARSGVVAAANTYVSTVADKKLEPCLLWVFRQMRFPASSGVGRVRYPLTFILPIRPYPAKQPAAPQKPPAPQNLTAP